MAETYYAISSEFDSNKADKWVMDNVIKNLTSDNELWKSRNQIKEDIIVSYWR